METTQTRKGHRLIVEQEQMTLNLINQTSIQDNRIQKKARKRRLARMKFLLMKMENTLLVIPD